MSWRPRTEWQVPKTLLALVLAGMLLALWSGPAHAATFTVNRTGDAPDANLANARCDVNASQRGNQCTLRAAIREANDTTGADVIRFKIVSDANVKTISPASALPKITEAVTMNGYTQAGASQNTLAEGNDAVLKVQLNGTNAGADADGLVIEASDSTIRGLVINRFTGSGVQIAGSGATRNSVLGNFIGTGAGGAAALGNRNGVLVTGGASDATIGGTAAGARNVISGNDENGVEIKFSGTTGNRVEGNFIGTNAAGTADLGNTGHGVLISDTQANTVGGTVAGARNVVSGNGFNGVRIEGSRATRNAILGNFIGTDAAGSAPLGNSGNGVHIVAGASDNTVGTGSGAGNRIAFNVGDGVTIFSLSGAATGNRILSNSIHSNGQSGIDLGADNVTANDADDPDTGENNLQNFPVISSAIRSNSTNFTTIRGTLDSKPNQSYTIQCFVAAPDPSGHGEGRFPAGQDTTVATNANGDASFACVSPVPQAGQAVTATATNTSGTASGTSVGDTSEFSRIVGVVRGP